MIQNMVLYCNDRNYKNSLEAMSRQYLNIEFGKDLFGLYPDKATRINFRTMGRRLPTTEEILYAANDIQLPILIDQKQRDLIKDWKLEDCIKLENDFVAVLANMEYNGIYLDPVKWIKLFVSNSIEKEAAHDKLIKFRDINWNSPKQVGDVFEELGIDLIVEDKGKIKRTTSQTHIQQFADEYPIIKDYLTYKGFAKATSTYGDKFLDYINPKTRRVHSSFYQILKTGRISSTNPNMQNIPQPEEFRACFTSDPQDDTVLVVADYSGQELRILADKASEPKMIDTYLHGDGDLHSLTARLMYKVDVASKAQRKQGKDTNFLMSYGGGPSALAKRSGISIKRAKEIIHLYFSVYKKLKQYFDDQFYLTSERGFILVDTVTNRRTWHPYYKMYKHSKEIIDRY